MMGPQSSRTPALRARLFRVAAGWALALAAALGVAVACQAPSQPDEAAELAAAVVASSEAAAPQIIDGVFSPALAWQHLESLLAAGSRTSGSAAAETARGYIRAQLEAQGFSVQSDTTELPGPPAAGLSRFESLRGTLPGSSPDTILLVAPYSSARVPGIEVPGANEGASGAALLLDLARVLSHGERKYTVVMSFIDGDLQLPGAPTAGTRATAALLEADGTLGRTRVALYLDRLADADLQVARDLYSHRSYREFFWTNARALGHGASFASSGFETPLGGHRAFLERGFRRIVALVDARHGSDEEPGAWSRSELDSLEQCSEESLAVAGAVVASGLADIEARLAKIDRFSRAPDVVTASDIEERRAASVSEEAPTPVVEGETSDPAAAPAESEAGDAAAP